MQLPVWRCICFLNNNTFVVKQTVTLYEWGCRRSTKCIKLAALHSVKIHQIRRKRYALHADHWDQWWYYNNSNDKHCHHYKYHYIKPIVTMIIVTTITLVIAYSGSVALFDINFVVAVAAAPKSDAAIATASSTKTDAFSCDVYCRCFGSTCNCYVSTMRLWYIVPTLRYHLDLYRAFIRSTGLLCIN